MLEPRDADIPALFLVLIVLPLVAYILLGKWNESVKKKERISLLAQLAAEEALLEEEMAATASVVPFGTNPKTGFYECARCFGPATTRCSRCKLVRYCSGKCQIIHWRHGHEQECQQLETTCSISSSKSGSIESFSSPSFRNDIKQPMQDSSPSHKLYCPPINTDATSSMANTASHVSLSESKILESNLEVLRREETDLFGSFVESSIGQDTTPSLSSVIPSKKASRRHKLGNDDFIASSEETSTKQNTNSPSVSFLGCSAPRTGMHESHNLVGKIGSVLEPNTSMAKYSDQNETNACEMNMGFMSNRGNFRKEGLFPDGETVDLGSSPENLSLKGSLQSKRNLHPLEPQISTSLRSMPKASKECQLSRTEKKGQIANESKIPQASDSRTMPAQASSSVWDMGSIKMKALTKLSKPPRQDATGVISDGSKKIKVLFPYEDFVKLFQCEDWDLSPRGLLNCGNSCYANAVLQCLTVTMPLINYLLQRSHSRKCCVKDWCLTCELEQHVMMLREGGGPLSPGKILSNMRSVGCRMGSGSQEDAHEFLRRSLFRLLVTSMQSICLEQLGGEKKVDPRLQETTFIQYTFGGRLRSKVKCLRCHQESERYESIMDLTLEIHGWVESLEDALTQFTASEDLDGENMYRCGRCAMYVKARKQLSIHEAPNILTIVLKRFQKGSYGKVNKCITFPEMLDMIPFMTGTGDSPPLYMLYAVVVHLDTLNAPFSGHYVSYVKDLQGTWFRINDTEVQLVSNSHVMSEGAYLLFYSRSCPRPPRGSTGKATTLQAPAYARHRIAKIQKSSRLGQTKPNEPFFASQISSDLIPEISMDTSNRASDGMPCGNQNILPLRETYAQSISMDFLDSMSSDWSLFTSSDESSFTTESTRDSFSTVDYADAVDDDSIFSIFNSYTPAEYSSDGTYSCRSFSRCKPNTRYLSECKNFVLDS